MSSTDVMADAPVLPRPDDGGPVVAFWTWWAQEGRERAVAAYLEGVTDGGVALAWDMAPRVRDMHPDLTFVWRRQGPERILLVLAPECGRAGRRAADRWRAAAPVDDVFEFDTYVPPAPDPSATVLTWSTSVDGASGSHERREVPIPLSSATAAVRRRGPRLRVEVSHPMFADLDEWGRRHVTHDLLVALLGQRVVEERLTVRWAPTHHGTAMPLLELPALLVR